MLMLEPASILTLESFRSLPPIVHKGNPGLNVFIQAQDRCNTYAMIDEGFSQVQKVQWFSRTWLLFTYDFVDLQLKNMGIIFLYERDHCKLQPDGRTLIGEFNPSLRSIWFCKDYAQTVLYYEMLHWYEWVQAGELITPSVREIGHSRMYRKLEGERSNDPLEQGMENWRRIMYPSHLGSSSGGSSSRVSCEHSDEGQQESFKLLRRSD